MAFAPTSPVTGTAQTGLTSPTYTLTADTAPANAKQFAVTALGGTQAGVEVHSVGKPFLLTGWKPESFRQVGLPNPSTGIISQVPTNTYSLNVTKGVGFAPNQSPRNAKFQIRMEIPAGADVEDPESIRAALSLLFGAASQTSAGLGDLTVNGIL